MDISTTYLGMKLKNPIVPAASSLSRDLSKLKAMEDAGASAVVLESLFEEQLEGDAASIDHYLTYGSESYAEATSYFPVLGDFDKGPEEYLEHIRKAKKSLSIPVIASLNGVSRGGWMRYARKMEEAGADAIELNVYFIPTDPNMPGGEVEAMYVEALRAAKEAVKIPVAIKVGPYFSNMANMARRLDQSGADGLVLFNRFYQPDIDLEEMEVVPHLQFSSSVAMLLGLRWVAILHGKVNADLAATNGVHTHEDVLKMLMAGAAVTQMAAALYKRGIGHITTVLADMKAWMEEHEYESVAQMRGSLSQKNCPSPSAFERANYMKAIVGYKK